GQAGHPHRHGTAGRPQPRRVREGGRTAMPGRVTVTRVVTEDLAALGDRVLVASAGPLTDAWLGQAAALSVEMVHASTRPGEPASYAELEYLLWWDPDITALFAVYHELTGG